MENVPVPGSWTPRGAGRYVTEAVATMPLVVIATRLVNRLRSTVGRIMRARQMSRFAELSLDRAPDSTFLIDSSGRFVYANETACRTLGYSREELLSMRVSDISLHIDAQNWERHWEETKLQGATTREAFHRTKAGAVIPAEIVISYLKLGGKGYHLVFARDTTERSQARQVAQESEERFRRLVENAGDAFFPHDIHGSILDANQRTCDSLGYTREELLGLSVADVELRFDPNSVESNWGEMEPGVPVTSEGEHRRKDGTTFPVEVRLAMFESQSGPLFLALARDVSDRRHLEAQLLQAQKMEAVGQLAGGVAHDFNNLPTAIIGYSELAIAQAPEERVAGYLNEILRASERASHVTWQLLTFSRRQIVEPRTVRLNDLIMDVDGMLRRLIGEDIELVILPAPDLGLVRVDPGHTQQVVVNLVLNARDAMPDGGRLVIETSNVTLHYDYPRTHPEVTAGDYVLLSVSDTGIGMAEDVKARVFEPFFTTKGQGRGTGLGLPTCYDIVAQAGGHMTVDSRPGQGATFRINLPRIEGEVDERPLPGESGQPPTGYETVLLVEDEPAVRELVSTVLAQQGYEVLQAAYGHEALRLARERPSGSIHLLVSDVVMPLTGGRELAEQLREIHAHVKVLHMSGYAGDDLVRRGVEASEVGFVQKPFTPGLLARKVRDALDS